MTDSSNRPGTVVALTIVLIGLGAVAIFAVSDRARNAAALLELRREAADLRVQLEGRDATISALQADVQQLRRTALVDGKSLSSAALPQSSAALPVELELARRVVDLTLQQSNTAIEVEKLLARTADAPSPTLLAQRQEAALTALEAMIEEHQQKAAAAKDRAAELLISMEIPADVSTLDAAKALDTASLRPYWPFFEAKREREFLRMLSERLVLRLAQERVDAGR
jgi:hypothetical protein